MNKNQQLRVDILNNSSKVKNKNAFANSFVFNDDFTNDNQFTGLRETLNIKDQNPNQSNNILTSHTKQSKSKPQSKPTNNQSNIHKTNPKNQPTQEYQPKIDPEQQLSPRKKKQKKQKRKLFDQQQMNNTFLIDQQQSYALKDKDSPKNAQSIKKNEEINNNKSRNLQINEENAYTLKNNQNNNEKQKNKEKAKQQTIDINEHIPKHNLNKQQQPQHNKPINYLSPSKEPSKPAKNTFHIQSLQTLPKPTKNTFHIQQLQTPIKPDKQPYTIIQNPQKDKQLTKISQITSNYTKINNDIKDIKQNYDSIEAEQQILFKKHNPRKQHEIRDFLTRKRMQKQHRQKKINQIRDRESEAMAKIVEEMKVQKQNQKQQRIKQIKQTDYVKPKQKRESIEQSNQEGTRLASQLIQKYRNQQPIHIRNQRQFQQILQQQKQQQKQMLLQRKQRYQSLDLQQLQEHKRQYEQRKQQMQNMKKQHREQQWNKINQDNQLLRDNIWKGPSHDIVDEELMEKKRRQKEPKEKAKKMKHYYEYIKHNFLPKTHQPKRSSPVQDQRVSESIGNYSGRYHGSPDDYDPHKRHVKKYKYYQGKAIGQVLESVPVARSYSEQKKIGEGYLQHLRNMPKKHSSSQSTTQIDPVDLQMISRKFNTITKVKRQPMPFYQHESKKRTVSISVKPTKQQVKLVYDQLKNEDLKLKSKRQLIRVMKQNSPGSVEVEKQVNAGMLLNMERKLDLLAKLG